MPLFYYFASLNKDSTPEQLGGKYQRILAPLVFQILLFFLQNYLKLLSEKKMASRKAPRLYKKLQVLSVLQACTCGQGLAPGLTPSAPKQRKSDGPSVFLRVFESSQCSKTEKARFKTLPALDCLL